MTLVTYVSVILIYLSRKCLKFNNCKFIEYALWTYHQYVYIALKWQHVVFDVVSYLRALGDKRRSTTLIHLVSSVKFGNSQFWFQNSIVSFWTKSKINKINNNDTGYIIEFVKSKIRFLFFEDLKFLHNLYLMTAVPVLKKFSLVSKLLCFSSI